MGVVQLIPLALNTVVFSVSAIRKLLDLRSDQGHFMMGPGRIYPAWLLPVAFVQEITMLVLLYVDRPLGVLVCCSFIGGGECPANTRAQVSL